MEKRVLNWRPSLGKHLIKKYSHIEALSVPIVYPAAVDLTALQSPVWDQGQSGSCSGYSSKSHLEFLQLKELKEKMPLDQEPLVWLADKLVPVSAFFIYWNERAMEGSTDSDAGATSLLDACIASHDKGVCSEATWPSVPENLLTCPSPAAFAEAANHKLPPDFYALDGSLNEFKRCLSSGFPFLFGMTIYDSFMTDSTAKTGIVPMPRWGENVEGGHALLCVGYDDATQLFKFKNSWNTTWGDNGYGYVPYDIMLSPYLSDDHITMRLAPTDVAA
jgi:hypothetical protein